MLQSTVKKSIFNIVSRYHGSIVDYGSDGLMILDRTGTYCHRIETILDNDGFNFKEIESDLITFFTKSDKRYATIHLIFDDISDQVCQNEILEFLTLLSMFYCVHISIHFRNPPISWKNSLSAFCEKLQLIITNKLITLSLIGTFDKISIDEKNFLFQYGILLFHVCDPYEQDKTTTFDILRDFSEYGFKIPFVWYFLANNDELNLAQIDDYLSANLYSGLLLPLQFHSPISSNYQIPSARDYIGFLVRIYQKSPYYDKVFFPLTTIVSNCYNGCANENGRLRMIQFLYIKNKAFKVFGHSPVLAASCDINKNLLMSGGDILLPPISDVCRECSVLSFCGGEFSTIPNSLSILCDVQHFFIKTFLWKRFIGTNKNTECKEP
jgi:hypothetical protein